MEDLLYFFSFKDANIRHVALGCMALGTISGLIGSFTFFKKQALVGDALAHALLPGVCVAFLLFAQKSYIGLLMGAMLSGGLALGCMQLLTRKGSKLKQDTATALVLSVFFGLGIFLLTWIQQGGNAQQTGLDGFLFGQAAALLGAEMWLFFGLAVLVVVVLLMFYKEFALLSFDGAYARSLGLPVRGLQTLLTLLTLLCVVLGIQAVGVVLIAALLIAPAAVAQFWCHRLQSFLMLSALLGAVSGLMGAYISYTLPQMPTGPWIVLVLAGLAMFSFVFAPRRGLWAKSWASHRMRMNTRAENVLKIFFKLNEQPSKAHTKAGYTYADLLDQRPVPQLTQTLKRLKRQALLVQKTKHRWQLSPKGAHKAAAVVRRHRLWELYLSNQLQLPSDDLHDKAERIEHVLVHGLDEELNSLLGHPKKDPHQRDIPSLGDVD